LNIKTNSFVWEQNFPAVFGQTSISFLKQCLSFYEAKNGDFEAAKKVVAACIKPRCLIDIKNRYPNAELLPVITGNKLPMALAQAIGLNVCKTVSIHKEHQRKYMNAMERLLYQPTFTGCIKYKTNYILVDDILTQGGTISSLRKHVLSCGGNVVAVVVLAYAIGSKTLTPKQNNIFLLDKKFGYEELGNILRKYLISNNIHELTNQQAEYLLRFKDIDGIVEKICHTIMYR